MSLQECQAVPSCSSKCSTRLPCPALPLLCTAWKWLHLSGALREIKSHAMGKGRMSAQPWHPCKKTFVVEMTHSFHPKARREKPAPSCASLYPTPVLCRSISPTHTSLLLHQLPWMAPEPGFWVFFKVDVSFFNVMPTFQ